MALAHRLPRLRAGARLRARQARWARPTAEEARAAIGGWLVLNDWSARDVQAEEARHGVFGPAVKCKTFANSLGCDVLSADELPDWTAATGRVRVDGEVWCEGTTASPSTTSAR